MKLREEIQGLRGLAVAAVVLFHSRIPVLPGGYLGVDVFFVISGFLITSIILDEGSRGQFSLGRFYTRRAIRLIPSLAVTILFTLAMAYVASPPTQLFELAKSALAALFFVSNIFFWTQVGYFDPEALAKPLLHTWSLGVEEQFYLIWPLAIMALGPRIGRRGLAAILVITSAISIGAGFLVGSRDPAAAFYLTPFRLAEFSIGGILATPLLPWQLRGHSSSVFTAAGLGTIIVAFALVDESWAANPISYLIPCLGAALIIKAGNSQLARHLLANKPIVWLGAISYSLYLIHWPVMVYLRAGSLKTAVLTIGLSLLFAAGIHYTVERPMLVRGKVPSQTRHVLRTTVVMGALLAVFPSCLAVASKGFAFRWPEGLPPIPLAGEMWKERDALVRMQQCFLMPEQRFEAFDYQTCASPRPTGKNVLVVGDSYAADFYAAAHIAYPEVHLMQATAGNCLPVLAKSDDANCAALLHFAFGNLALSEELDTIVLAGNWGRNPSDVEDMADTASFLKGLGRKVVVVGPPLRFSRPVPTLIFEARTGNVAEATTYAFQHRHRFDGVNEPLEERARALDIEFVRTGDIMCDDQCQLFDSSGNLLFIDFGHLSKAGLRLFGERLRIRYPELFTR